MKKSKKNIFKYYSIYYTDLSSAQISNTHTLMAVSNEPIEKPLIPANTNSHVNPVTCGINAKVTPINAIKNTKIN